MAGKCRMHLCHLPADHAVSPPKQIRSAIATVSARRTSQRVRALSVFGLMPMDVRLLFRLQRVLVGLDHLLRRDTRTTSTPCIELFKPFFGAFARKYLDFKLRRIIIG